MPKWELFGRETFTMEGDPAICVITDSYLKGLRDFDVRAAYEAFLKSATSPGDQNPLRPDIDHYLSEGFVPLGCYEADLSGDNSVSHALEYYVADHSLSLLADALGHREDALLMRNRSLGYRKYYDRQYGTLRPLNADGSQPAPGREFRARAGFPRGKRVELYFLCPSRCGGAGKADGRPPQVCGQAAEGLRRGAV